MIPLSAENNGWLFRGIVAKESWEAQASKFSTCMVSDTCGALQMLPSVCEVHVTWCTRQRARVCDTIYLEPRGKRTPSTGADIFKNVFFCHMWHEPTLSHQPTRWCILSNSNLLSFTCGRAFFTFSNQENSIVSLSQMPIVPLWDQVPCAFLNTAYHCLDNSSFGGRANLQLHLRGIRNTKKTFLTVLHCLYLSYMGWNMLILECLRSL